MIYRVNVVLNRTVVVDNDWRFSNLAVVIFRVKVSFITSVDGIKTLVIGQFIRDVVGLSVIPSYTWTLLVGPKMSDRLIFFLGTLSFKATQFQSYSSSETQVQEKRCDKSFQVPAEEAGPGYRLGHQTIPNGQANAGSWLSTKKSFAGIIAPNRPTVSPSYFRVFVHDGYFFRHTCKEMHAIRKLSVW